MSEISPSKVNDNSCDKYRDMITARLDGRLSPKQNAALERHLNECPKCSRYLDAMSGMQMGFRAVKPPDVLADKVMKDAKRQAMRGKMKQHLASAASFLVIVGSVYYFQYRRQDAEAPADSTPVTQQSPGSGTASVAGNNNEDAVIIDAEGADRGSAPAVAAETPQGVQRGDIQQEATTLQDNQAVYEADPRTGESLELGGMTSFRVVRETETDESEGYVTAIEAIDELHGYLEIDDDYNGMTVAERGVPQSTYRIEMTLGEDTRAIEVVLYQDKIFWRVPPDGDYLSARGDYADFEAFIESLNP